MPAEYRLNQLRLNAQRIEQWASALLGPLCRRSNIPAAAVEAVEGSLVVQRHNSVVGKVDRATPILNSKIFQVKFNPYWTVPKSIIEKDLITYMNEDPEYLTKFHIRIFDGNGNEIPPTDIDWSTTGGRQVHLPAGSGRRELDGSLQDRLLQQATTSTCTTRRKGAVRRERPLPLLGLHALRRTSRSWWPGCCATMAAAGPRRPSMGAWEQGMREDVKLRRAGADPHHLHHRLGQPSGHGELPRRRLQVRRAGHGHLHRRMMPRIART